MKGSNLATALRLQRVSKSPLQFNLVTLKAKSLGLGPLRDPHPQALILKSPTPRPQLPKTLNIPRYKASQTLWATMWHCSSLIFLKTRFRFIFNILDDLISNVVSFLIFQVVGMLRRKTSRIRGHRR
jgi:hypothetical protein